MDKPRQLNSSPEYEGIAATPSRAEPVNRELRSALQQAEELRKSVAEPASDKETLLLQAIEELQSALEELRVAEEHLRDQNEELLTARASYADLFECAPDAYLITDLKGLVLDANQTALKLLGVERAFIIRKPLAAFLVDQGISEFGRMINRLSTKHSLEPAEEAEIRLRVRDSQPIEADIKVARTTDGPNREVLRWVIRDATKRKATEATLRELTTELEQKVRARTAELEQVNALRDELLVRERAARAEAEEANRSKDEFFAIVSHELRTPLNTILGWAQMLRSDKTNQEHIERAAEVIERNAKAQARIINDILDVSRAVTGNLRLDTETLDLANLVESVVEDTRPAIDAKQIILTVEIDRTVGSVWGDWARLKQIVENLLTNSIKFTEPGQRIVVRVYREGGSACITVQDTGIGIAPEFLPHVFDRFRQAETPYTKRQAGLGLGLSIARLLVEMHGGSIHAASDGEGRGSTFTIRLPIASDASAIDGVEQAEAREIRHTELLEGLWTMVVDDDADALEMMRVILEGAGARVTTCESCDEAIGLFVGKGTAALTQSLPDILIADIAMPGEDGFDLIRRLRSLEPVRGGIIPAIALTADSSDEVRENAIAAGYQLHLSKPMHLDKLVEAISTLALKKHQSHSTE